MEDIYKLIDDINLQKLDNLDTRVNDALSSPKTMRSLYSVKHYITMD